jgi:hypothetical protein
MSDDRDPVTRLHDLVAFLRALAPSVPVGEALRQWDEQQVQSDMTAQKFERMAELARQRRATAPNYPDDLETIADQEATARSQTGPSPRWGARSPG